MAKLYFHYSTMNAGKSTALLQAGHNYRERGMRTLVYTASADTRGAGRVHSRIGISGAARPFGAATDLRAEIAAAHGDATLGCVLVDEAQFLTRDQVRALGRVADELGIPVLCYGLRTDFRGELFPGSAALLAWADDLIELKTVCHCGRKATMVVRVGPDGAVEREGAQVEIGGNERYLPLCRRHFLAALESGRP
ncbi:MAG TPA: thymidine kinase [Steroidobacteraceae bacterium]|nr:thymidine kinase [Steroidobacteraceae bacterium]